MLNFVAVIMAGGQGQRFWPLSTANRPKQFLDLEQTGRTLIQSTVDRILPMVGSYERIMIATGEKYRQLVMEQLPEIPAENLIIEPEGRDSAPAITLASLIVAERFGPGTVVGFFSSDHSIKPADQFREAIGRASKLAVNEHGLVTLGIRPDRAATGYGYIETGTPVGDGFSVKQFVEKPNSRTAEIYLAGGKHLWNAGIFIWEVGVVLRELAIHAPQLLNPLQLAVASGTVSQVFPTLPKISIDYSLMEKTTRAFVIPADFQWDDIGDWVALERHLRDAGGDTNTVIGRHVGNEASGNIIYTDSPEDTIITLGVHDLVVVKRGNTVLLMPKSRAQDIKNILDDERLSDLELD